MLKRQLSLLVISSALLGNTFSTPAVAFEDEDARRAILEVTLTTQDGYSLSR